MTFVSSYPKLCSVMIVDIEAGEHEQLMLNPEELYDNKDVNIASIQVPGMSHPRLQFVGGGERVIQFTAKLFYAAYDPGTDDVMFALRWLQSLVYPEHGGTMLKRAPHKVHIDWGNLLTQTDQTWVVRRVSAYSYFFDPDTLLPLGVDVDLELVEYIEESVDYSDIRTMR